MNILLYLCVIVCALSCDTKIKEHKAMEDKTSDSSLTKGIAVTVSVVKHQEFNKQIISNGKVEAINKSELRFKTNNSLASIKVKNGSKVLKNQTIATLHNEILATKLSKAKIDFEKAQLKLKEEKIKYGINNSPDDSIATPILRTLKFKSGFYDAQNNLKNAQLLFNETILKAPFDGVVANLKTKIGNYISSNDVFCTVLAQKKLEVIFFVLESELKFIKKNQRVDIKSFINEDKLYEGFIAEINPLIDDNGLIQLRAIVKNADDSLFDGMNVKITINEPVPDVIVIPKEALVLRSNREVVFSVINGIAQWNYVEIQDENSKSYAIKKGLKLNDTIIISGNMNLSHDAQVRIKSTL